MKKIKQDLTIYQMEQASINFKKTHTVSVSSLNKNEPPQWFVYWSQHCFEPMLNQINNRLDKLESRIDNLVSKNNLKE